MTLDVASAPTTQQVATAVADAARLDAINRYEILDTPPEPQFDRIAKHVSNVFDLPMAVVSIIDAHRQWYKASIGMKVGEAYAPHTICRHSLVDGKTIVVPNALDDPRFAQSPLVLGEPSIRFCASAPLKAEDGSFIGTLCGLDNQPRQFTALQTEMFEDIAKIAMEAIEMRRLVGVDKLTGALTRAAFLEVAETAVLRARRYTQDLICIILEVDHFESITKEYGPGTADQILRAVSDFCRTNMRETDYLCRFGGAEFAMLLEQSDTHAAFVVAERLRRALARSPIKIGSEEIFVTASFGSAQMSTSGNSLDVLIGTADARLSDAKRSGNNCTRTGAVVSSELRRRVVKAGQITVNDKIAPIDCTITSLSRSSAGVAVVSATALPARFKLAMNDGVRETECHVVGKSGNHLDVAFA